MSVSEVRALLVGPYVLVFVCCDMKGLQACINSRSYRPMAEQHVLQQLRMRYVVRGGGAEIHRGLLG